MMKNTGKRLYGILRIGVPLLAAICATFISLLDMFGFLSNVPWLKERLLYIILLLVALHLLFAISQINETDEKMIDLIEEIKKLGGVEIKSFEGTDEVFSYVARKLRAARKSVRDITWGLRKIYHYRTVAEKEAYEDYLKAMEEACRKGVEYREISSLSDEHYFQRAKNLIDKGYYNYHLGYYDISATPVPLMSFIIIDDEVIAGFYRVPTLPSEGEVYLTITHPYIVRLFKDYYETLWADSIKIKEGNNINYKYLEQIRKRYEGKSKSNSESSSRV